jgi:hypothetical protein
MFDSLSTSETWALALIVLGVAAVLASRFSKTPIRIGYEGSDDDDRVLGRRDARIFGVLLVVAGSLVFVVDWVGWALAVAAFVWSWRVAKPR